jgi:hypothetical protein
MLIECNAGIKFRDEYRWQYIIHDNRALSSLHGRRHDSDDTHLDLIWYFRTSVWMCTEQEGSLGPVTCCFMRGRREALGKLLERGYGAETIYGNGLRLEPLESESHVARGLAQLGSKPTGQLPPSTSQTLPAFDVASRL